MTLVPTILHLAHSGLKGTDHRRKYMESLSKYFRGTE